MADRSPALRVRLLTTADRACWDALVTYRGAGFMQSWAWSEFKALDGYDVTRAGVVDGDVLIGGGIAYLYASPAEACLATIPDGPVLDWSLPTATVAFSALVETFERLLAADRMVVLRLEPRLTAVPAPLASLPRSPVDLVPEETLEIDLTSEDDMLEGMKPKGRYNTRLAARRGVEVVDSVDPADVHELYAVLEHTARAQGFRLEPKSFFINLARALFPSGARLAFARWKGMTLAAALTVRHASTVTYLYGGHLPLFPDVMASYALHWHVMREAAADGYRTYDLYGYVAPGRPEHPYDGFSRFKEKLGGRPVRRMGSRDVVFYDRLAGAAVRAMRIASRA
jgi:peptidoglycan pentaglycine glycine transferase (the first glycine)